MENHLHLKRCIVVGIVVLFLNVVLGGACLFPTSAINYHIPQIMKKHFDPHTYFSPEEWIEQATAFPYRNRGLNSISCVNGSVVWATAFNGDTPSYPCQDYTRTIDGGTTWIANTIPNADALYCAMIYAWDANNAWVPMYAPQNGYNGLFFTSDGGTSWVRQESAYFNYATSFPNCVYFWDSDVGWCMGDPVDGYFEIYTTTDGGTSWSRVPKGDTPVPLSGEYGIIGSYCAVGDTLWFGTSMGRVYKTIDKGLHWTVSQTTLRSYVKPVFRDATHGLVIDINTATTAELSETIDGGQTWRQVHFTGPCYNYDLVAVPGTVSMYISVGAAANASGASFSLDGGHSWTDYPEMVGVPLLSLGFTSGRIGWAGSYNTDEFTGGIFKHVPSQNPQPAFSIEMSGGKGCVVNVINVGEKPAANVTVDVSIIGGFFVHPTLFSTSSGILAVGSNLTLNCDVRGISLGLLKPIPSITANVTCSEGISATKTARARIFFSRVTLL